MAKTCSEPSQSLVFNIRPLGLARKRLKFSYQDVTFHMRQRGLPVTPKTVRAWERGDTTPDADKLPTLLRVLGLSLEDVYIVATR